MIGQWENECITLPVLSMAQVMIAQWEKNVSHCPLHGSGSIPGHGRVFQGISLADHTLPTRPQPALQKMAQSHNSTTQPVDIEEEGQSPTMDRQCG